MGVKNTETVTLANHYSNKLRKNDLYIQLYLSDNSDFPVVLQGQATIITIVALDNTLYFLNTLFLTHFPQQQIIL